MFWDFYTIVALIVAAVFTIALVLDPSKKARDYLLRDGWQILLLAIFWLPAFIVLVGVILWSIRRERNRGS